MRQRKEKTAEKNLKKVISAFLCIAMLADPLSVLTAKAATSVTEARATEAEISQMLSAGAYEEGQAVVILRKDALEDELFAAAENGEESLLSGAETLMNADSANYELTSGELLGAGSGEEEDLSIVFVESEELSTRQLLRKLMQDERVLSVQPNYTFRVGYSDGKEEETSSGMFGEEQTATPSVFWDETEKSKKYTYDGYDTEKIDLTGFEWAMNREKGDRSFTIFSKDAENGTSDLNLEGWNGKTANASCTVVVFDDGVDYTHPDLKGVMADLSGFIEPLARLGVSSGRYGCNVAPGDDDPTDPMPYMYEDPSTCTHGTHVAGLIASEWNDFGTSGVANGVKLIAIKLCGKNGFGNTYAQMKAYNYIYQLARLDSDGELNIRVVNESFGSSYPDSEYCSADSLAVAQLANKGIIVVRSAGNNSSDKEIHISSDTALMHSSNILSVGASEVGGHPDFRYTDYGVNVGLFAQGSETLSTIAVDQTYTNGSYFPEYFRDREEYEDTQVYFQTFYQKDFKNGLPEDVRLYTIKGQESSFSAGYSEDYIFDTRQEGEAAESGSLRIDLSSYPASGTVRYPVLCLKVGEEKLDKVLETGKIDLTNGEYPTYQKLKEKIKFFGIKTGTGKSEKATVSPIPYLFTEGGSWKEEEEYTETAFSDAKIPLDGCQGSYGTVTVNYDKLEEYAKAYGLPYTSPVSCEIEGDKVCYYLYMILYASNVSGSGSEGEGAPYIYIDCMGAGDKLLPYTYWQGTSMAAPVASGMAAVQYERLAQDEKFRNLSLREQAVCLVQELKANAAQSTATDGFCSSGLLDATVKQTKSPVIAEAAVQTGSSQDAQIRIEGLEFGQFDAGSCSVEAAVYKNAAEGKKKTETSLKILSWEEGNAYENGTILCDASGLASGVYTLTVTNAAGSSSLLTLLKFSNTALFETEIVLPASYSLKKGEYSTQDDVADFSYVLPLAGAGGKLYMVPDITNHNGDFKGNYRELWEYDPEKGTDETAFTRIKTPQTLSQMFNYPDGYCCIYGLTGADESLWIYGKGTVPNETDESKKETSMLVRMDPATYETVWYAVPEEFREDTSSLNPIGDDGQWFVFTGAHSSGKRNNDDELMDDRVSLWIYNPLENVYFSWIDDEVLDLPEGLTIQNNLQCAAGKDEIYVAGSFRQKDGSTVQKAFKYHLSLEKKNDGSWNSNLNYDGELDLPEFDQTEAAAFTLTMNGNDPIITAAHTTQGEDYGYDTFLYSAEDGTYTRFPKRFSVERVSLPRAAMLDGRLYVSAASFYSENEGFMMLKAATIVEKEIFTVTFDHQGHGIQPEIQQLEEGEKISKPDDLTAEGYTFGGWYRESDCTNAWNFETDTMPAEDLVLYAKWTKMADPEPPSGGSSVVTAAVKKAPQPKAAVTPVVLAADGTQTLGSSTVSLPPNKLSDTDRACLVEQGSWKQNASGYWQFFDKDGKKLTGRWALIPDRFSSTDIGNYSWFYLDGDGNMVTGWQWIKGEDGRSYCYYFNEEAGSLYGACLLGGSINGWQLNEKGVWTENGVPVTR